MGTLPYNTPGWLHVAKAAQTLQRPGFALTARQGVDMWIHRWYCPACGGRRPDGHLDGCEVVKQLGKV